MLKRFFISTLGALTAIWISVMMIVVLGMLFAVGAIVNSVKGSKNVSKLSDDTILCVSLEGAIEERTENLADFMSIISEQERPTALSDITAAIAAAKDDKHISGIYLRCAGASAGLATCESIRESLKEFKKSGKWIVAYGDAFTQGDYYIASVADELLMNPQGAVDLRGLSAGVPFFKGLLDKLGVEMQIVKVGTFKSAVEPYILTGMSEANRLQTQVYLSALWGEMVKAISASRNIPVPAINQMADSVMTFATAEQTVEVKLVDGLKYYDELQTYLKEKVGKEDSDDLDMVEVGEYLATSPEIPNAKKADKKIAIYYAYGDITESGARGIASERVVPDILDLADDDDIDALVLRVNSGGGSAFASEQIWHALEVFKSKGKTLYVSMGDYAASGGYYISCGAEKIFAEPMTLTGSIGIFGMVPNVKGLLNDKLGVNVDFVNTNPNANMMSVTDPMTPFQRARLQASVDRGYELFTNRCAEGRKISQDSIKAIAEGRVWDGKTAKTIGLVDELGSLTDAVKELAKQKGYKKYQIVHYPDAKSSFWDILSEMQTEMKLRSIKEEMGPLFPLYESARTLKTMDPVQARMAATVVQ